MPLPALDPVSMALVLSGVAILYLALLAGRWHRTAGFNPAERKAVEAIIGATTHGL